jgi:hypothetical protein
MRYRAAHIPQTTPNLRATFHRIRRTPLRRYWATDSTVLNITPETPSRLFNVPRVSVNAVVAAAGLAWALHYPAMKIEEATRRLARYNELTLGSMAATQASIHRLPELVASSPSIVQLLEKTLRSTCRPASPQSGQ